jgi:hypothetical protein
MSSEKLRMFGVSISILTITAPKTNYASSPTVHDRRWNQYVYSLTRVSILLDMSGKLILFLSRHSSVHFIGDW